MCARRLHKMHVHKFKSICIMESEPNQFPLSRGANRDTLATVLKGQAEDQVANKAPFTRRLSDLQEVEARLDWTVPLPMTWSMLKGLLMQRSEHLVETMYSIVRKCAVRPSYLRLWACFCMLAQSYQ
ncbi:unnamed protein product [Protopolystoma xenopodis]|uniref:Uncharacterized protein n=1 Tax=Protopolystoma xenopodis TaxID=117903 RepID=A0A448WVC0_9PLAT|nr:unnamed protein product [Protopolystoma xenopodis]